ncbi:MAG: ABC transporter permease [Chloroflexota bacterium]
MSRYLFRRLMQAIPLLFAISVLLFIIMNSIGDPVAALSDATKPPSPEERARLMRVLGLDEPIYMQYLYWLVGNDWKLIDRDGDGEPEGYGTRKGILRGDLGRSIVTGQPALVPIRERLPNTLILMLPSYSLVLLVSISLGVLAAVRPYSLWDNALTAVAFIFYSMPIFLVALGLIFIFAVGFRNWGLPYLPIAGMYDNREPQTLGNLVRHMILPITSLVVIQAAGYMRFIRASMMESMASDYVRTAYSKGLRQRRVVFLHVFRNASLPLITLIGFELPFILGGAVVTEQIFAWPGMGRLFIDSLNRADYSVLMGILMLTAVAVVSFQILTDVVYTWVDPRIKLS